MKIITLGFILVLAGVLLLIIGMLSMAYHAIYKSGAGEGEGAGEGHEGTAVRGGGVIMIGPIPIIFGTDVGALKVVMILALLLMIVAAILLFVLPLRV